MAELGGPHLVGESIVAMLRSRRALLDDAGLLGPVPAAQDIAQVPVAKLISASLPTSGLTITCYHIARSDQPQGVAAGDAAVGRIGISLELHYLLACWASTAADELALMSWAMLELNRFPALGPGLLQGAGWGREETIQLVPGTESAEQLARLWEGFKTKVRLSSTFKAKVVRIGYGTPAEGPPVVASRFAFSHGDVALEPVS